MFADTNAMLRSIRFRGSIPPRGAGLGATRRQPSTPKGGIVGETPSAQHPFPINPGATAPPLSLTTRPLLSILSSHHGVRAAAALGLQPLVAHAAGAHRHHRRHADGARLVGLELSLGPARRREPGR